MTKSPYIPPGEIILTVEAGSTLHGTSIGGDAHENDDLDLISIVVEHPDYVTGLKQWQAHQWRTADDGERSRAGDVDHSYYSLRHFTALACQGNPSIINVLFAPPSFVHHNSPVGRALMQRANWAVSNKAIPRYRGYMRSQFNRLVGLKGGHGVRAGSRPELVERFGYDTKFAMHMIRLGLQGIELCERGNLLLPMHDDNREICRHIRNGEWKVEDVLNYAISLDAILDQYQNANPDDEDATHSQLQPEPQWDRINEFLHSAYLYTWHGDNEIE